MKISRREDFGKLYQEHFLTGLGVELGVQYGAFSLEILKYWKGKLLCIDPWEELGYDEIYEIAKQRLGEDRLVKLHSIDAVKHFKDESLDFIYIDACHYYNYVKQDIEIWYPKIRKGGIISGHDYTNEVESGGVIKAVDEFIEKNNKKLYLTEEENTFKSWWFIK